MRPSTAERVLLLVDFKNQIYRAAAAHGSLFSGRTFTGGLYGFLVSVCRAVNDVKATSLVVATDSPPYVRLEKFDQYKSGRKERADEMLVMKAAQSAKLAQEFLGVVNIPFWSVQGFEFDDVAAWALDTFSGRFDRVVAMTNDSDLFQLFDVTQFSVYRGAQKGVYGRKEFIAEHGPMSREDWVLMLALTGTHNAVPGIRGIGPATAKSLLKDPIKLRRVHASFSEVITRNKDLIKLPHPRFPFDPGLRLRRHAFSMAQVSKFCNRYDINLTASIVEALQDLRWVENE